jgi:GNAT superfamily N-acetyltransferase
MNIDPSIRVIRVDDLIIRPLTSPLWSDFVELFGEKGAYGGCWCMWWRLSRREFEIGQGAGNRRAMKHLVDSGSIPGLLAYKGKKAIGWCSIAPREQYGALERSRVLKRLDSEPVWSIVCFFIHKECHGRGVSEKLIRGAVKYAGSCGAKIVEAYPTIPRRKELPPVSSFMGLPQIFRKAGFAECKRPSASKVVMRYYVDSSLKPKSKSSNK